jgi:hypothetical protein
MDDAQSQLLEKLKTSNSVLVTVSRNPSVDQLSALLGLTILLNKQGKHAAAVFSGEVPSTIEFLQPEDTIEKNTDSLRDFIIALDKHKADKLRYKVEDSVVRIFITPYRTSISQDDLEFSQGDFNIDLIVAIGVKQQEDLDEAIIAHGRILHDAAVASINTDDNSQLGTINWRDPQASSLSELITRLAQAMGKEQIDEQIATALLTGIVAETDRFRNEKTSSQSMSASAVLMAAGANQQLVASKLEEGARPDSVNLRDQEGETVEKPNPDGEIEINHESEPAEGESGIELPAPSADSVDEPTEEEPVQPQEPDTPEPVSEVSQGSRLVTEPPTMGGSLTANSRPESLDPSTDPLSVPQSEPPQLLDHQQSVSPGEPVEDTPPQPEPEVPEPADPPQPEPGPAAEPPAIQNDDQPFTPPPASWAPSEPPAPDPAPAPEPQPEPAANQTLSEIESAVESPHAVKQAEHLDSARDEVTRALSSADAAGTSAPEPIQALNALPVDLNPSDLPSDPTTPTQAAQQPADSAAPPVPPPIPFQFGAPANTPPSQQ